jgi:hypothetical protein
LVYSGGEWLYESATTSTSNPDTRVGAFETRSEPGPWEAITPIAVGDDSVALLFHTGFLCADPGNDTVAANRPQIGDWEKFSVIHHEDGTISLRAHSTGKHLCLTQGETVRLTADGPKEGASNRFTPVVRDDKLYLTAPGEQYLSAQPKK